jgi:general stress protein 13
MKCEKGSLVSGKVTGISEYGVFIQLDNDYTGMIHISEISDNFVNDINDYFKLGDIIKSKIIEVDNDNKKVKLSIKNRDFKYSESDQEGIKEEGTGFLILKKKLDKWIKEYSLKK